ncbi:hypothetical protein SAZ11_03660 [Streptomyces sp. FXJ1.4098]|nr:hypothetical protein [Streptomyces sp. FXJ1.4098]
MVVAHLAVKLGRPVRWIEDRLESMLVATRAGDRTRPSGSPPMPKGGSSPTS